MKKICCLLMALLLGLSFLNVRAAAESATTTGEGGLQMAEDGKEGAGGSEEIAHEAGYYGDLPVTGTLVWHVQGREIRCVDAQTGKETARMPLSGLYAGREDYLSLTRQGEGVMLCTITGANTADSRVNLYFLALRDGGIQMTGSEDATDVLGPLFNGETAWLEVDMIGCAGGLFIAALDPERIFRMFLFNPETRELRELGQEELSSYSAVLPYGEDLLLIGAGENAMESEELTRISLADGARAAIGFIQTGSLMQVLGCAMDEESQTLYYSLEGIGYRVKLAGELTPEAFCLLPEEASPLRYGAVAGGKYVLMDEEGNLLFQDATATLTSEKLRILDLTGSELVEETASVFNRTTPEYLANVMMGEEPKDVLEAVLNQSTDYDAYVISLGSELYQALYSRGYLGDLSGSAALEAAANSLPESIRVRILSEGRLVAFPTSVMNSVFLLNTAGISELTGLSREEIPTDWPGFLSLLRQLGEEGLAQNGRWVLYESGISAETFRVILTTWILRDALLWLNQDRSRLGSLQMTLTPALQALDAVDLTELGFPETEEEDTSWQLSDEAMPLLEETEAEISVMNLPEGAEYWPLSLAEGGERLAPQDVGVIVLNPFSAKGEGVRKFVETLWTEMDVVTRMELDAEIREPVKNDAFNEDIAYMESLVPMYEEAIAGAENEAEKAELQDGLNQMRSFLESYQKNAAWLISEESIALYSRLETWLALHGDEFWNEETGGSMLAQYLDGMLSADQFVYQLVLSLQMAQMESE